ncbi:hypothetical protein FQN55_008880 [Onygenales sp. PD_40]|nr:hypothetical protein FQN55_008880 [Onygenales sp. PD_40]
MAKFLVLLALSVSSVVSQTLVPAAGSATFPACAVECPLLKEAQVNCVPPAAPVTNQATFTSCFCQSALLQVLHGSPNGICDAVCPSPADLVTLQQWYAGLCSVGKPTPTKSTSKSDPNSKQTATSGAGSASTVGSSRITYDPPQNWYV